MANEADQDLLKELFNMSLGRSVSALSEMVDDEISLTVPALQTIDRPLLAQHLHGYSEGGNTLVGMPFRLEFTEGELIDALALLRIPRESREPFLDALFGEPLSVDSLSRVSDEAMQSMGEIFLYTCASSFSHFLDSDIESRAVSCIHSSAEALAAFLPKDHPDGQEQISFVELEVSFHTVKKPILGWLSLIMDLSSKQDFQKEFERILTKYTM